MANKCKSCAKSVYPMDPQINLDGTLFHKSCAKCEDCNCQITISNFTKHQNGEKTVLLCKTHYFKRFHEGGSYVGGDRFQVKNPRDEKALGAAPAPSATSVPSTGAGASADGNSAYSGIKLKATPKKEESSSSASEPAPSSPVRPAAAAAEDTPPPAPAHVAVEEPVAPPAPVEDVAVDEVSSGVENVDISSSEGAGESDASVAPAAEEEVVVAAAAEPEAEVVDSSAADSSADDAAPVVEAAAAESTGEEA